MADVIILEDNIEYNVHNASAESTNTANSTISTSSADTLLVLTRNRLLRNACKDLLNTFHRYKETMEELIEKPVEILDKQTNNCISADKATLKLSEKILKQAVRLLKEGVKTMKKAMNEHSRKIEELCNYEDCSNSYSSKVIFENCKTAKGNEISSEMYGLENTSSIASSDIDVTYQYDVCPRLKGQPHGDSYTNQISSKTNVHRTPSHQWKCTNSSSDESAIDCCIEERASDVSSDESVNDSFTCSESEYKNDFYTSAIICSSVSDVESLTKELTENHNFRTKDELIFTEIYNASFEDCTPVNGEKTRNVFTDWGPFVEELVDVFEDIASLPDENNPLGNKIDRRTIIEIFV
ncbi:uncharacterized protein LOC127714689 [Mytilus californianus]|uniref:uncharacterized protein LOC127714689 n=1 Tax=Mytilus californianus TaxID=6549 RepID=UPI00224760C9|nr:uncharacterized protein LOC127714689 [Mytilus californianus]